MLGEYLHAEGVLRVQRQPRIAVRQARHLPGLSHMVQTHFI